jgi:hypothetical protein
MDNIKVVLLVTLTLLIFQGISKPGLCKDIADGRWIVDLKLMLI